MMIDEKLFDKMLQAAILKDRINYTAGLMSQLQAHCEQFSPLQSSDIEELRRGNCQELHERMNSLGVEPLRYETLLKEEIQDAQSRSVLLMNDESTIWEQRRYEIAKDMLSAIYVEDGQAARADHSDLGFEYKSLQGSAKEAVRFADALIEELKKKANE